MVRDMGGCFGLAPGSGDTCGGAGVNSGMEIQRVVEVGGGWGGSSFSSKGANQLERGTSPVREGERKDVLLYLLYLCCSCLCPLKILQCKVCGSTPNSLFFSLFSLSQTTTPGSLDHVCG